MLGGIGKAFADANFRQYSIGSIVSWLSFFVQAVAVSWVAWSLTHSTRWLAAVALLDTVPMSLLAPLGGVLADRHDRFRVLLVAYAFATLQAGVLAALAFSGQLTIGWLAGLAFAHGVIHAFSVPASFGLLPRFVTASRLPACIAVASAYTQLGLFIGPALAGWVILHFGAPVAFASNVVGYGVFFWSAARMRTPHGYVGPTPSGRAFVTDLTEGLRTIARHRGVTALLVMMLFGNALAAALSQMLPAFADRNLHVGVEGFSTLLASAGIGATLSALWLAQGGARRAKSGTISWAFLGFLATTCVLTLAGSLPLASAAMVGRGFFFEICRTAVLSLLQVTVPDELRGRLMSTQFLLQQGANAFGVAAMGLVADRWGLVGPVLCGVVLALAVWALTLRSRADAAAPFTEPSADPA